MRQRHMSTIGVVWRVAGDPVAVPAVWPEHHQHQTRRYANLSPRHRTAASGTLLTSAANRLIGEVVQSRRRPLLGPSPG